MFRRLFRFLLVTGGILVGLSLAAGNVVMAASYTWDFNNPSNYGFLRGEIFIQNGVAKLLKVPEVKGNIVDTSGTLLKGPLALDIIPAINRALVGSFSENGVQLIDISNPASPQALGYIADSSSTYLTGISKIIHYGNNIVYVFSQSENGLQTLEIVNSWGTNNALNAVNKYQGNVVDPGLVDPSDAKIVTGHFSKPVIIVVGSGYSSIQVIEIDTTNPHNLTLKQSFTDGSTTHFSFPTGVDTTIIGGELYAVVASNEGVSIIKITESSGTYSFSEVGYIADTSSLKLNGDKVKIKGNYAYVTSNVENALNVIDISNPASPSLVKTFDGPSFEGVEAIYVDGNNLYVAAGDWFLIFDITNPANPVAVAGKNNLTAGDPKLLDVKGIVVDSSKIYTIAYNDDAFQIFDESNLTYPTYKPYLYSISGPTGANERDWLEHTMGTNNQGTIRYQVEENTDGTSIIWWKWFDGSVWMTTNKTDGTETNTIDEIEDRVYMLGNANDGFAFQIFFVSDGTQKVEVDKITLYYGDNPITDITLSSTSVDEEQPVGTVVGVFSAADKDHGDTHTYALVSGTGDEDNSKFTISGNQLKLNFVPDYENPTDLGDTAGNNTYAIRVRATDSQGNTYDKQFIITVNDIGDNPPTDITLSNTSVSESATTGDTVGTFSTTDPDNPSDSHTYTLVSGTGDEDNSKFTISGDQLKLNFDPNYENPQDLGDTAGNNTYSIRVRTTDSANKTFEKQFIITVTNVNEAPTDIQLSSTNYAENQPAGSLVANLTAVDEDAGDTHAFSLVSGTGSEDNAKFTISGSQLIANGTFDYENPDDLGDTAGNNTYSIRIRVEDSGGNSYEKVAIITVTDANDAPTDINLSNSSVDENTPSGSTVGVFSAVDQDTSDTYTYALVSGTGDEDNSKFTISGNQLKLNFTPDYENPQDLGDTAGNNTYSVRVQVTDSGGATYQKVFIITINDLGDQNPPTDITLSNNTIAENSAVGATVGVFSTTDADAGDSHTYSLVSGTGDEDNSKFTISGNQLKLNFVPNYENPTDLGDTAGNNTYSIRVRTTDTGGNTYDKVFTITVTNQNDAPTNITLSPNTVEETSAIGTVVGNLSTTDEDSGDTHTYALVSGTGDEDNSKFTISGNQVKLNFVPDYETPQDAGGTPNDNIYSIRVRTTDASGATYEKALTIEVTNKNEAVIDITLSNTSVAENEPVNTTIGVLSAQDLDASDTHTFSLVSGSGDEDNSKFKIAGNQLQLNFVPDYENPQDVGDTAGNNTYSVRVKATDTGGNTYEKVLIITVTNRNEAPTDISLSANTVEETSAIGTVVGNLSTTDVDAGDSHTYSLVSGTGDEDNSKFTISGNQLKLNFVPDYENPQDAGGTPNDNIYSIRIRTTDAGGATYEKVLTVEVTNKNEAVIGVTLSNSSVDENQPVGTIVGVFSAQDLDASDTHTYSLVGGAGGEDNSKFTISGNQLKLNFVPDYENPQDVGDTAGNNTYAIRVRVQDSAGNTYVKNFIITVNNVNDVTYTPPPTPTQQPAGTNTPTATAEDQDEAAYSDDGEASGQPDVVVSEVPTKPTEKKTLAEVGAEKTKGSTLGKLLIVMIVFGAGSAIGYWFVVARRGR